MHVNRSARIDGRMALQDTESRGRGTHPEVVVVMAKEPEPGRVKTRLCPPLSPEMAARCHEAFVTDTLHRLGKVAVVGRAGRELAVVASDSAPRLRALAAATGWHCVEQVGTDLGSRMRALLAAGVGRGARVVLLGSDSPDLPIGTVPRAFLALDDAEVVLGPATDGGYYLIGCRDSVPDVFGPGVAWGSPTVFSDTVARLAATGMATAVLEPWPDVDDWRGLVALAARLRSAAGNADDLAPQSTAAVLAELAQLGLPL
jgi:rSAM/selenodomain-associated transferase 1